LGIDSKRISVGGLSAGGNLTAAIALRAVGTGDFKLCLEVLDCAATDNYMALTPAGNERTTAFSELYCNGNVRVLKMPYCSPAYATDAMLVGMPKTLVIAAGLCPFKETNERLAGRLAAAGTEVTIKTFSESHHGFVVRMVDEWQLAQDTIIRYINESSL
jgi:acetyl esterase